MANYTFGPAEEGITGIDMLVVESAKVGGVGLLDHLVVTLLGMYQRRAMGTFIDYCRSRASSKGL